MTSILERSRIYIVDAFATGDLQGNPAAVVLSTEAVSSSDMADAARKLAQPAQAFLWHPQIFGDFIRSYESPQPVLRWYGSRGQALPLCGHATLAATIVLFSLFPELQHFTYDTLKGPIQANRLSDGSVEAGLLISKQPSKLPASEEEHAKQAVARACSFQVEDIVDFQKAQSNSLSEENLLVVLRPEVDLKSLSVDTEQLGLLSYRGFYLTQQWAEPHPKYTFKSRVFFPDMLVPEDQACGSAHTLLVPYWAEQLGIREHAREPLLGLQVSANGAEVGCRYDKWEDGAIAFLSGAGKVRPN